jgi:hypothetical protein
VTFSGNVSSPGSVSSIGIDVLKSPELDTAVDANWIKNVVTTVPSSGHYSVTLTSGRSGVPAKAWPDGGIAKTRVMSNMTDGTRFQTFVQDRAGVPTLNNVLTLTDIDPSPTSFGPTPRRLFDRSLNFLSAKDGSEPHFTDPTAQANETSAYYNSVRTCPGNASTSCASTLVQLNTLTAFKSRYLTANGNGTLINAKYYNVGDLGIGRAMTCNVSSSPSGIGLNQSGTVEVACAVSNYAPVSGGNVRFDDQTGSFAAMDDPNQAPFATVAMVYRGFVAGGSLNRTFFAVYGSAGVLANGAAKLDNKGYNTFIPGNCQVCHAGGSSYDQTNHGVFNAYFLPFDLNAFGFNANHTRAAQEDTFRKLNYEVMLTDAGGLPAQSEVVNGWYSNLLAPFSQASPPAQNNSFIPPGWNGTARTRDLYTTVIAANCRGCHLTSFNFPFRSSTDFLNTAETAPATKGLLAISDICTTRKMPNAEQSQKHGWTDPTHAASLRAMLLTHIPQSCTNGVCATVNTRCDPRDPTKLAALKNDFDGDGTTDIVKWTNSNGTWSLIKSSDPSPLASPVVSTQQWGLPGDIPVPSDYDSDGRTDFAVWRPSEANWYVIPSGGAPAFVQQWGVSTDKPVPGDYDRDGKIDLTIWRPSEGRFYVLLSGTPGFYTTVNLGANGDIPVPADYDGDGLIDFAVWTPTTGIWRVIRSSDNVTITQQWGVPGDIPLNGDFDGDGKTDFAIFRPSSGQWWIIYSKTGNHFVPTFGTNSQDRPVPGDYDGDGFTDLAIFHGATNTWEVLASVAGGFSFNYATLGVLADVRPY